MLWECTFENALRRLRPLLCPAARSRALLPQSPPPLSCSPWIGELGSGLRVKSLSSYNKLGFTPPGALLRQQRWSWTWSGLSRSHWLWQLSSPSPSFSPSSIVSSPPRLLVPRLTTFAGSWWIILWAPWRVAAFARLRVFKSFRVLTHWGGRGLVVGTNKSVTVNATVKVLNTLPTRKHLPLFQMFYAGVFRKIIHLFVFFLMWVFGHHLHGLCHPWIRSSFLFDDMPKEGELSRKQLFVKFFFFFPS
jgi:hypothetical protein